MPSLNSLPDLCLLTILSRIPLRDLIRTRQVCTRWKWIQSSVADQIRSLTILIGKNAHELIAISKFKYPYVYSRYLLNEDGTNMFKTENRCKFTTFEFKTALENGVALFIGKMFPNVRTLKIALKQVYSIQLLSVVVLIRNLRLNVVALELYCDLLYEALPQFISHGLFQELNLMSSLKSLTMQLDNLLYNENDFYPGQEIPISELSVVSQLDEFKFYSRDGDNRIVDVIHESLKSYAQPGQRPLRIQFGHTQLYYHSAKLDQFEQQFCSRFTQLRTSNSNRDISATQFGDFCNRFSSITRLEVYLENITIRHLFTCLAKLTQLVHLELDIDLKTIRPDESTRLLPQISSLKSLRLGRLYGRLGMTSHNQFFAFNFPWTFPNVQVLDVHVNTEAYAFCDICQYNYDPNERDVEIQENQINILKDCFKHLLVPFRECAQLHTVHFSAYPLVPVKQTDPLTKQDIMQPIELIDFQSA